jgi:hypothetical protein
MLRASGRRGLLVTLNVPSFPPGRSESPGGWLILEITLTPSALKSGAKSASTYESVARTDPGEIFAQIH